MAIAAVVSMAAVTGVSAYASYQQNSKAQDRAINDAKKAATAAEQANNKANQKRVNSTALLSSNQMAAKAGQSGTMLTGPTGVDLSALQLGKTTLLGGS